jgi:hypothetical protein
MVDPEPVKYPCGWVGSEAPAAAQDHRLLSNARVEVGAVRGKVGDKAAVPGIPSAAGQSETLSGDG